MTTEELKETIRDLISKAKPEKAIDTIKTWAHKNGKEDLKDASSQLANRLSSLNKKVNMGLISNAEATVQSNQIIDGVLNILKGIDTGVNTMETGNTARTAPHKSLNSSERKTLKIFLASSNELKTDRDAFELHFGARKRKTFVHDIEVILWEDFIDAMSKTRLQDEYNKAVQECDIFVMLFFTKVGKYTEEEFETAFGKFKENGKPLIYTYFKNAAINTGDMREDDFLSLLAFKKKIRTLEHFVTEYNDATDLNFKFSNQLDKLLKENQI